MAATIYVVTGGARSGKSRYAQDLCEQLSDTPIYLATARVQDDDDDNDFARRIQKHQQDRQQQGGRNAAVKWTTIEEPLTPSHHAARFSGNVVLVDCMTLWLTNYMMQEGAFTIGNSNDSDNNNINDHDHDHDQEISEACDRALTKLQAEFELVSQPYNVTFVVVTNEVGSGTHAETHLTRIFVDAQGWMNQFVARKAQQVIHVVCGMPLVLKNELQCSTAKMVEQKALEAQRLDRHLSARGIPMDAKGYFLVKTDPTERLIVVTFHSCILNVKGEVCDSDGNMIPCSGKSPDPMKVWKCRTAKEICMQIFEQWEALPQLELTVGHAAYIGREVQRAEHSLYHAGAAPYRQD